MMFILLVPSQRVKAVLGITQHQLSTASLSAPPSKSNTKLQQVTAKHEPFFTSCRLWTTCKRPGCSSSQTTLCATCRCPIHGPSPVPNFERTPPNSGSASSSTSVAGGLASSRHPVFRPQPIGHLGPAETLQHGLTHPAAAPPSVQVTRYAANQLRQQGWDPSALSEPPQQPPDPTLPTNEVGPPIFHRGWQRAATQATHTAMQTELFQTLGPASQAMMASQSGPFGSRTFTTILYTGPRVSKPLFPHLLLRRLRLPLPLTESRCRCRRVLDPLGDHRAACPWFGALRSRGCPLERAAARICREAGAKVSTNTPHRPQHMSN